VKGTERYRGRLLLRRLHRNHAIGENVYRKRTRYIEPNKFHRTVKTHSSFAEGRFLAAASWAIADVSYFAGDAIVVLCGLLDAGAVPEATLAADRR
jgi:hypothetical protein